MNRTVSMVGMMAAMLFSQVGQAGCLPARVAGHWKVVDTISVGEAHTGYCDVDIKYTSRTQKHELSGTCNMRMQGDDMTFPVKGPVTLNTKTCEAVMHMVFTTPMGDADSVFEVQLSANEDSWAGKLDTPMFGTKGISVGIKR